MSVTACGNSDTTNNSEQVSEFSQIETILDSEVTEETSSEVDIATENDSIDENDTESILKQLLKNKISAAANDDFDTYCSFSSQDYFKNMVNYFNAVNNDEVTESTLDDYVMEIFKKMKSFINENEIQDIEFYDFTIEHEEQNNESGLFIEVIAASFKMKGSNGNVNGEVEFLSDGNEWDFIYANLDTEQHDMQKTANSTAKLIFNSCAELLAECETEGEPLSNIDLDWVIDDNYGDDKLKEAIYNSIENTESLGRVHIYGDCDELCIQWTADEDIGIIGQYPDSVSWDDEQPEWGSYTEYGR
jgi:hypothetical protein